MTKRQPTVVSLGEVLWDVFPDGPRFGGAPANVACHAAAFGARSVMVSQVGSDQLGNQAIEALRERGVVTDYVSVSATHPTGTVVVELDAAGKPSFSIGENVAWDHLVWSEQLGQLAAQTDAVCFGTLGQRCESSRRVIEQFVSQTPRSALRILDVNLRPPFDADAPVETSLEKANILKLSDDELDRIATACVLSGS
jgi:fructokinase